MWMHADFHATQALELSIVETNRPSDLLADDEGWLPAGLSKTLGEQRESGDDRYALASRLIQLRDNDLKSPSATLYSACQRQLYRLTALALANLSRHSLHPARNALRTSRVNTNSPV